MLNICEIHLNVFEKDEQVEKRLFSQIKYVSSKVGVGGTIKG